MIFPNVIMLLGKLLVLFHIMSFLLRSYFYIRLDWLSCFSLKSMFNVRHIPSFTTYTNKHWILLMYQYTYTLHLRFHWDTRYRWNPNTTRLKILQFEYTVVRKWLSKGWLVCLGNGTSHQRDCNDTVLGLWNTLYLNTVFDPWQPFVVAFSLLNSI